MCLNPVKIRNKSLVLGQNDWSQYELTVPCGQCAECKQLIRDQWYLRAYWQAKYTFDQNGYVLFDTLTYDDSHLPHLSDTIPSLNNSVLDFPCFSHTDFRDFLKRLRGNLEYAGYEVKDRLKYFLCSEYGTDPHGTNRPHYHILFYVTDPNLDPETLSVNIDKAWQNGRTDGVPYRGLSYVINRNTFGPRYNTDIPHMQAVCGYVMKYITKDSDFESRIKYRLNVVMDRLVADVYHDTDKPWWFYPEFKDRYREVKRLVSQFHRQSQHFGEYALQQCDIDEVMKTGLFSVPDRDSVVKYIPIPMYYSRKLFSTQIVLDDGRRAWIPNELGKRYKYRRTYQGAVLLSRRLQDWLKNLHYDFIKPTDVFRLPSGATFSFSEEECYQAAEMLHGEVCRLMHGRSLLDLAVYMQFYRGRVIPRECLSDPVKLAPMDIVSSSLAHDPRAQYNVYRRLTYVDSITNEEVDYMSLVPESQFRDAVENKNRSFDLKVISVPVFNNTLVVKDDYLPEFDGFDDVIELYEMSLKIPNMRKQSVFDRNERTEKILKFFGRH